MNIFDEEELNSNDYRKLIGLRDDLYMKTGIVKLYVVLDELTGCVDQYCVVNGQHDLSKVCCCLDWLEPKYRLTCVIYLKDKRELCTRQ